MKISSYLLIALATAACTGGGKKKIPVVDAPRMVDAAPQCALPPSFTMATDFGGGYQDDRSATVTGNQEYWVVNGDLDAEVIRDAIAIELYEGPAPNFTVENFPATPFTMQLTGNELNYFTCSMCISLFGNIDTEAAEFTYLDDYMATAGSVTITTLTPTMIAGTIDNATFAQVDFDFDNNTQTVSDPACATTGPASIPFTATLEAIPDMFKPGLARRRQAR